MDQTNDPSLLFIDNSLFKLDSNTYNLLPMPKNEDHLIRKKKIVRKFVYSYHSFSPFKPFKLSGHLSNLRALEKEIELLFFFL